MDSHLFRLFAQAATSLLTDARIEKIQEPFPNLLAISCYGQHKKFQLLCHFGKQKPFFFISLLRLTSGKAPSAMIMRLRRYFGQRRIAAVVSQFCQRKLWLMASSPSGVPSPEKVAWLCLDLLRGPELHFFSPGEAPEPDAPRWPLPEELNAALSNWRSWPVLTPGLRKTLQNMDPADQFTLLEDLRLGNGDVFLYRDSQKATSLQAWPLTAQESDGATEEVLPADLDAFERAGRELVLPEITARQQQEALKPYARQLARLERLEQKLREDESRLKAMAAMAEQGKLLSASLWRLDGASHCDQVVADPEKPPLSLNRKYSIRENMERFFHQAARGKRGLRELEKRRASLEQEKAALSGVPAPQPDLQESPAQDPVPALAALQRRLPRNIAAQLSSDGHILLRGKDSRGNLAVRRFASPHDLWVHVQTGPGAHVVIRRAHPGEELPMATLEEAGALALAKSWLAEAGSGEVMYAEVRHVKPIRGARDGMVSIDRLFKTLLIDATKVQDAPGKVGD